MTSVLGLRTFRHGDRLYSIQEGFSQVYGSLEGENDPFRNHDFQPVFDSPPGLDGPSYTEGHMQMAVSEFARHQRIGINLPDIAHFFDRGIRKLFRKFRH